MMRSPISLLSFFQNERNYPQFINKKARRVIVGLIGGILVLPLFFFTVVMWDAQIRNHFVNQETLASGLLIVAVLQFLLAVGIVLPLFSKDKERIILDAEDLTRVVKDATEDPSNPRDPGTALIENIWNIHKKELSEQERQLRNLRDLEVRRLQWRDMTYKTKAFYVLSVGATTILAGFSIVLMLGFIPKRAINPAIDSTPNGRMANQLFSGEHDLLFGLFSLFLAVTLGFMFHSLLRTDFRSRSDDALKKFMNEMNI